MSVILLNMLTMMMQHHGQSKEFDLALEYLNYVFTGIFTLEAIIRLTAMRLEYFKSGMNVFDFVIVVFSIAGKSQLFKISTYTEFLHADQVLFHQQLFSRCLQCSNGHKGFLESFFLFKKSSRIFKTL